MLIIIDNYDSFTQNLAQHIGLSGFSPQVMRNDDISLTSLNEYNPTHIILSPGPGHPQNSEKCIEIISKYANTVPILGVCLGHQCIGHVYGATIQQLDKPIHGKINNILHNQKDLFYQLSNPFSASRYHSLILNENNLPNNLEITAYTEDRQIMGCRHKIHHMLRGIQFHPESLWTNEGQIILNNFLFS